MSQHKKTLLAVMSGTQWIEVAQEQGREIPVPKGRLKYA